MEALLNNHQEATPSPDLTDYSEPAILEKVNFSKPQSTNYRVMNIEGGLVKAWTKGVPVEEEAVKQLQNVSKMPFIHKWVAAMPDVHAGKGATIGSVIPTYKALIPAAVGVDIGCGMMAQRTNLRRSDLPKNLRALRGAIEEAVPHGFTDHGGAKDEGSWRGNIPPEVAEKWKELENDYLELKAKHQGLTHRSPIDQLGTLGSGNHFIEICVDEDDAVWILLHSGSRGPGNRMGSFFIKKAKEQMEKWFISLPDRELAYLPEGTDYFSDYIKAVRWSQAYAMANREIMMDRTLNALAALAGKTDFSIVGPAINCHHNYVEREHHFGKNVWVTRKGAIRARKGDLGIIPGSMGNKSYIVEGKGNKESFESCSHGAGRAMSRTKARNTFSVEDHKQATKGIECRKDEEVLDETPGAYKDIDAVMSAQQDLVDIKHQLRQLVCVKG